MKGRVLVIALLIPVSVLCALPIVLASEDVPSLWGLEMYTGIRGDTQGGGYGYLGFGLDRQVGQHTAIAAKASASSLRYEYDSGGRGIEARSPGLKLQAGIKYFDAGVYLVVTGGLELRDTELSPDDPGAGVRGYQEGGVIEAAYGKDLSEKIVLGLIGSYSSIGDGFWGRGRLKRLVPGFTGGRQRVFAGVELVGMAGSEYSAYQIGGLVELQRTKERFSVLLNAGFSRGDTGAGYLGLEFYHRF